MSRRFQVDCTPEARPRLCIRGPWPFVQDHDEVMMVPLLANIQQLMAGVRQKQPTLAVGCELICCR